MKDEVFFTTSEKVNTYSIMLPLLKSMYNEFKELSKQKPDASISKSKILIVNRLLEKIRTVLDDQESIEFLDLLNEDDIPQASDVVIILSQYVAAMVAFKEKYFKWDKNEYDDKWYVKDDKKK
jgi:hypothetical protein